MTGHIPRRLRSLVATLLGLSLRTIQVWEKKARAPEGRGPGRPAHSEDTRRAAREIVRAEWKHQGVGAGEGSVHRGLAGRVSRRLVRAMLKELKSEHRRTERARIEANRVHIEVHARDAVWSEDATELGRNPPAEGGVRIVARTTDVGEPIVCETVPSEAPSDESMSDAHEATFFEATTPFTEECPEFERPGCLQDRRSSEGPTRNTPRDVDASMGDTGAGIIQAEVTRDVATTESVGMTIGPPMTEDDIIAHLERAKRDRGTLPFVLVLDNGGANKSAELAAYCRAHGVVLLFNEPHTPEHNSWVEHGHRELKEQAGIASLPLPLNPRWVADQLRAARDTLDGCRIRRSRGWWTAMECGLALPGADTIVSREVFCRAAREAIENAKAAHEDGRERRRAVREAILAALESFGLITRTRGGLPYRPRESATIS